MIGQGKWDSFYSETGNMGQLVNGTPCSQRRYMIGQGNRDSLYPGTENVIGQEKWDTRYPLYPETVNMNPFSREYLLKQIFQGINLLGMRARMLER